MPSDKVHTSAAPYTHGENKEVLKMKNLKKYRQVLKNYISPKKNTDICQDHAIVFIKPRLEGGALLLFNHVYDNLALHHGAPYFLRPQQGFVTYNMGIETLRKLTVNLKDPASPIGVTFQRIHNAKLDISMDEQMSIRSKVQWLSQLDITYITNPIFYGDPMAEKEDVEKKFLLGPKYSFWRCCVTIFSAPDESAVSLEDFSAYCVQQKLYLPLDLWGDAISYYTAVRQEWQIRLREQAVDNDTLANFPPAKLKPAWAHPEYKEILTFDRFPLFASLFCTHPRKVKIQAVYEKNKGKDEDKDGEKDQNAVDGERLEIWNNDLKFLLQLLDFFVEQSPQDVHTVEERSQKQYEDATYTESESSDLESYFNRDHPSIKPLNRKPEDTKGSDRTTLQNPLLNLSLTDTRDLYAHPPTVSGPFVSQQHSEARSSGFSSSSSLDTTSDATGTRSSHRPEDTVPHDSDIQRNEAKVDATRDYSLLGGGDDEEMLSEDEEPIV